MIGVRRFDENCSDCEESWNKVAPRKSPRKNRTRISRERYEKTDALSPLRSPIRSEIEIASRLSSRSKTNNTDTMTSNQNVMSEVPLNQVQGSDNRNDSSCWKVTTPKKREIAEEDFPCLDVLKFTPEPKKKGEVRPQQDWATLAEQFEKEQRERDRSSRYKRRLLLSDDTNQSKDRRTSSKTDGKPDSRPRNYRKRRNAAPPTDSTENDASLEATPTKQRRPASTKPRWQRSPTKTERLENPEKYEQEDAVLARRQKQIDLGRSTDGYKGYVAVVPRVSRTKVHPHTPNKYLKFSRRSWDAQIKIWRRKLHNWDPEAKKNGDGFSDGISDTTSETSLEVSTTTTDGDRGSSSDLLTPPNSQASCETADVFLDNLLEETMDDDDETSKDETITENSVDDDDVDLYDI